MTKDVEKNIIETLLPGAKKLSSLIDTVARVTRSSPQAVYKCVRKLKQNETLTIYNRQAALSLVWINKQKERFAFAEYAYKASEDILSKLKKPGAKITFRFSNYAEMDLFWAHVYDIVSGSVEEPHPRYFSIPHDFFLYGRYETDMYWIEQFFSDKTVARFVVTHPLSGDTVVVKARRKSLRGIAEFHIGENPLKQASNIYYNLLGEYVFKATFDPRVNILLETFIAKVKKLPLSAAEEKEIATLLSTKGTFTLTITKNKKKAEALEKKLKKFFE